MSKAMSAQPGDILNKIAIRAVFDCYFGQILVPGYLEPLPRATRKQVPTYQVKQCLPQKETYTALRTERFTTTAEDLVGSAQSEIENLTSELREWRQNLPPGIDSSSKADEIEEAASALEGINFPDTPEGLADISVVHLPSLDLDSRPKRASEVTNSLDGVIDAVNSEIERLKAEEAETSEEMPGTEATAQEEPKEPVDTSALEEFVSELETVKSELEGVSFPSMM